MRKNKNVVSANFRRGVASDSCIEVFLEEKEISINIWEELITYGARRFGDFELDQIILMLEQEKEDMQKQRNFPPVYEEMLSELIEVQRERYNPRIEKGNKEEAFGYTPNTLDISTVEKIISQHYKLKDLHIDAIHFEYNKRVKERK